jgi:hypothetical protein
MPPYAEGMSRPICGALLGLTMLAIGTACGRSASPAASPGPAPSASSAASPAVVDDPPGSVACVALQRAVTRATLMDPGVVDTIVRASRTADAPVADAAERLAAAYASAVAAHGLETEPDAIAAVSVAGADMTGVCADSGLDTVG